MPEWIFDSSNRSSTIAERWSTCGAHLPVEALRVVRQTVFERLGHRPQARERSAQVVRDPGDEFATRGVDGGDLVRASASRRLVSASSAASPRTRPTAAERPGIHALALAERLAVIERTPVAVAGERAAEHERHADRHDARDARHPEQ